jgi:hypothetical protein
MNVEIINWLEEVNDGCVIDCRVPLLNDII